MDELKALNIDLEVLLKESITKVETMMKEGHVREAEIIVKQLLIVEPNNVQGLQLYGLIQYRNRKYKESIDLLKKAILLDPDNADNYNNISLSYLHNNQADLAMQQIQSAIQLKPENHNYLNNLALVQRASGQLEDSIDTLKKSLEVNSQEARTWESLGSCYGQQKDMGKAIECFLKSLEIDPKNLASHVDLAYAYHLTGQWEKAWKEYEHRFEYWYSSGRNPGRFYEIYPPAKSWNGTDSLDGKKIIVYCEQGAGDMIQFIRFVPELNKQGAKIIIDAPQELASLFSPFGEVRTNSSFEEHDYHCSILSLPYLLNRLTPDLFLSEQPYLFANLAMDMSDYRNFYKIGIVWAGNPGHPNDSARSCYLRFFRNISKLHGVKLFSLQKEIGKRAYATMPGVEIDFSDGASDIPLVDMTPFMGDFAASARVISGMDLIITVDTSMLHLAGALGKPVWGLIPYNPDWRWTLEGETSVWYSSLRLFRQDQIGDWESVFNKIEANLREYLNRN